MGDSVAQLSAKPTTASEEILISWGESYPMIDLNQHLPGALTFLEFNDVNQGLAIVTGERAAGHKRFVEWVTSRAEQRGVTCVVFENRLVRIVNQKSRLIVEAAAAIDSAEGRKSIDSALAVLHASALEEDEQVLLVFRRIETMRCAKDLLAAFKARQEAGYFQGPIRLVFTTTTQLSLQHDVEISGLWDGSRKFRLPSFRRQDIAQIARPLGSDADYDDILERTGGQVLLVQEFIRALRDKCGSEAVTSRDIRAAQEQILRSPPQVSAIWKSQLRELLKSKPDLRRSMEQYTAGVKLAKTMENDHPPRWPPPLGELELFVSGWVGQDRREFWGIRSPLHKAWAREVLVELGRSGRNS